METADRLPARLSNPLNNNWEMTMVDDSSLKTMYEASEQELRYGIGLLGTEDMVMPVPMFLCFYRDWTQETMGAVATALKGGVELSFSSDHVYLASRDRIEGREHHGTDTSILRAPAWDASLENPDPHAVRRFDAHSDALGYFLLILQTPDWECVTIVHKSSGATQVGAVQPPKLPAPPDE